MGGVDVGADNERAVLGERLVGAEHVTRRADLAAAELLLRHAEVEQQVLHHTDAGPLGEDRQHVEAEGGGELEPRQDEDLVEETAVLLEPLGFLGVEPLEVLEQLQVFDLAPHVGVAADRVVVGEGDDIERLLGGPAEDVEGSRRRLLVVDRGGGVDVEIDPAPFMPRRGWGDRLVRGGETDAGLADRRATPGRTVGGSWHVGCRASPADT
jgi:hypothetical protein